MSQQPPATDNSASRFTRLSARIVALGAARGLNLLRAVGLGGAGTSLVIATQIVQIGAGKDIGLYCAFVASLIGLPIWLLLSSVVELFILLGDRALPFFHRAGTHFFLVCMWLLGGLSTIVQIAGTAAHVAGVLAVVFVALVLTAFAAYYTFAFRLAHWWYSDEGPHDL